MGKSQLINTESTDRTKWPAEARICEHLWNLTQKLRDSNIMQEYIDKKITDDDVDILLQERDNSNMIQDLLDLKQEVMHLCTPIIRSDIWRNYDSHHFKVLADLGTVLAKSPWWERYQTITQTMGTTCVLSIRTAESLFKRDPYAEEIRTILRQLVEDKKDD